MPAIAADEKNLAPPAFASLSSHGTALALRAEHATAFRPPRLERRAGGTSGVFLF
jgi:hypothetical protein